MKCIMDMRYAVPPLINQYFFMLPNSQQPKQPWNQDGGSETETETETDHHHISRLLLLGIAIILFLFTSLKLPLAANDPIRIRTGDFSGAVAISLVASFIFPPQLSWAAFILIICCSPWHHLIFNHFLCFLQAIITPVRPHGSSEPEAEPPHHILQIEVNEGQAIYMQDESCLDIESAGMDIDLTLEA